MPAFSLVPEQPRLRLTLPTVEGNVDYQQWQTQLQRMDQLIRLAGVETQFVQASLQHWTRPGETPLADLTVKQIVKFQEHSRRALRCNIARTLLGEGFRDFAVHLAESPLLQWFCGVDQLDVVQVPAKSSLQRYATWLPAAVMRPLIEGLLRQGAERPQVLKLVAALDLDTYFVDTSCVKANIHFPVDWVLLRDATRTLMKAVLLIRKHGLKHRMEPPEMFLRRMNRLCIQMSQTYRKASGKKARKRTLRAMKRLVKAVARHALRYRDLLDRDWAQTDWTRPQAEQVLDRVDGVLLQLPAAEEQAHERIIGERPVKNEDKILSFYEPEIHVIVRHKAGAEVEFGNTLLLGESPAGLIVDWQLWQDGAPADARQMTESVARVEAGLGRKVRAIGGDRGFDSQANQAWLKGHRTYNGICPRRPRQLQDRNRAARFRGLQRRRSQTEGRIGIFKHEFLGQPLRAKGFARREQAVAWGVMAHNLWVLARLPQVEEAAERLAA